MAAAHYMAQLCLAITLLLSPHAIVISGGILQRECLFPMIRKEFTRLLNGYAFVRFSHIKFILLTRLAQLAIESKPYKVLVC